VTFAEERGRRRAALQMVTKLSDENGVALGRPFGRRRELDLAEGEFERVKGAGLDYRQQVNLPPGRYQVRMVVCDPSRTQLGGAAEWIEIPDLSDKHLALSGLFLGSAAPSPSGSRTVPVDPREAARGSGALRRLRSGDTLYFEFYVYNAAFDEAGASDVVLQAQILAGENVMAASKPQAIVFPAREGPPAPQANGMSLEGLPAGSYELRVVVTDLKANATVIRSAEFAVD
jgi:hypothetical protein